MTFPDYEPTLNTVTTSTTNSETTSNGKSFLFDFETGDFIVKDGKIQVCSGLEAMKIWINKLIRTEKFKFKIYETGEEDEYGISLQDLINSGHPQAFIQAEIQREISEALLNNKEITSVGNFAFSRDKRILTVTFEVTSIYGTSAMEVTI
jgi:hypothetical protein